MTVIEKLEAAKKYLLEQIETVPSFVVTLGSGLAGLADEIDKEREIAMGDIPFLKSPSVKGHGAKFIVGTLDGVRLLAMQGRLHYYEGLSLEEVVYPFRVLAYSGAKVFVLTNASGGIDPALRPSDIVLVKDHLNLTGNNPLIGKNEDALGPRFPDLTDLYSARLRNLVKKIASESQIPLTEGVYCGCSGPSYETPAEIKMYRLLGASVVGMSTVPEAIALKHMGKEILTLSCVTNQAAGMSEGPLEHTDVLDVAKKAYPKMSSLIRRTLVALQRESHG